MLGERIASQSEAIRAIVSGYKSICCGGVPAPCAEDPAEHGGLCCSPQSEVIRAVPPQSEVIRAINAEGSPCANRTCPGTGRGGAVDGGERPGEETLDRIEAEAGPGRQWYHDEKAVNTQRKGSGRRACERSRN